MFERLPEYPWQKLKPFREIASRFPGGAIDLSVGSPIDPTPVVIQNSLGHEANSPGYPNTWGDLAARKAIADWYSRRRNTKALRPENILLTIGSKEFISWLPFMLGLGPDDVVVQPTLAYTAYEVGAKLANTQLAMSDDPSEWPKKTKLIWLNSPGNPNGGVHSTRFLRRAVERARELGAVIVNDECYAEMGWTDEWFDYIPCILDESVTSGDMSNILSIYSLSKQSNLAGYRAAFAAGDQELISSLVNLRMHLGMMVPGPVQKAMIAALVDDEHVAKQKEVYRERREILAPAVEAAGYQIKESEAGLYLWATKGEECWLSIQSLAEIGIVAVPGEFYGIAGKNFVRFSITASTKDIEYAAARLRSST